MMMLKPFRLVLLSTVSAATLSKSQLAKDDWIAMRTLRTPSGWMLTRSTRRAA